MKIFVLKSSKICAFFVICLFGFVCENGFSAQRAKKIQPFNFVVDRYNQKIPKGFALIKGESVIKDIKVVQDPGQSFKQEMIFSFSRLKGFNYEKKVKNGQDIFELTFDGVDRDDDLADRIFNNLSRITLDNEKKVFNRKSINFIGKTADNNAYFPQMRILIGYNPQEVAVDIVPELELKTVRIEVINHKRFAQIKEKLSAPDPILLFTQGDNLNVEKRTETLLVFLSDQKRAKSSSNVTRRLDPSCFCDRVFDNVFSCAKEALSNNGAAVYRANCRGNIDDKNLWQLYGIGAQLAISVRQICCQKTNQFRLIFNTNISNQCFELNCFETVQMNGFDKNDFIKKTCYDFFKNLTKMG